MSAVQLWRIDPATIPTPGPGSVLLFVDMAGVLSHKTDNGAVVPGLPAGAVVDALAVGAYAVLSPSGSSIGAAMGAVIVSDGGNLSAASIGGALVALPVGQSWRYMGGSGVAYLFQRVA